MSVKKIILELSHAHLLLHHVWTLLCYTDGKGSSCSGDHGARKGVLFALQRVFANLWYRPRGHSSPALGRTGSGAVSEHWPAPLTCLGAARAANTQCLAPLLFQPQIQAPQGQGSHPWETRLHDAVINLPSVRCARPCSQRPG